jgi:hypothetical protein
MRALMRFIDEMPAAAVRVPTFNLAFLQRFAAMSEDEFVAFAKSKPLRKEFMLAMGRKGFPEKEMNTALDRMQRTYERMDLAVRDSGGPWLLGKVITLADVAVMPAIVRMADLGLDGMGKDMPRVSRWYSIQADVLLRLAADRALPAFAAKGGGADVILSRRYHASYLKESETRVRKAATLPSSTFMSIFITSATRRSRNEPAAVSTA